MRPQSLVLGRGELKHEIRWKALLVPANLLIEAFCCDAVESCKVGVEQYLSTAENHDGPCDVFDCCLH
jgi:hypothetical protein